MTRNSADVFVYMKHVHSSVRGPMQEYSLRGSKDFEAILDNHFNWLCVFPIKQNLEAASRYQTIEQYAEGHTERKVNALRSERRVEY